VFCSLRFHSKSMGFLHTIVLVSLFTVCVQKENVLLRDSVVLAAANVSLVSGENFVMRHWSHRKLLPRSLMNFYWTSTRHLRGI